MRIRVLLFLIGLLLFSKVGIAQISWQNVDSLYQPLPPSVHVYFSNTSFDTSHFRAYYFIADLKDKKLDFTADTTLNRRLTPAKFYEKNNKPLLVVNTTFFSFATNQNLNVVIKDGKFLSHNLSEIDRKQKDSSVIRYVVHRSAIGVSKKRNADIAWLYTDTLMQYSIPYQYPYRAFIQGTDFEELAHSQSYYDSIRSYLEIVEEPKRQKKWKMQTAVGGGPVLVQNEKIFITNDEEMMFTGKAIHDKHPRTAMGYTKDNKLIVLVVEGRNPGVADGVSLTQLAAIMKDLGCVEALNLDGGGSSCMLINGKETIKVSDKTGQRPVPAVFMIQKRR